MRDEVQRWLSACIVAGYDTPDGDNAHVAFEVDAPTLEALCRRWLAVEDAHRTYVNTVYDTDAGEDRGEVLATLPESLVGFVRIVPEQGEAGDG